MNVYLIGMAVSFAVYLAIGFFISRKVKDANDFYVAGRNAPMLLIVGSMIASYVSTGMFMGDAGEYYSGLFSPMTVLATMQVVGYIIGAVFFGRYLRRSRVMTIPEFFGMRFCSEKVRVLATVTSVITMTVYLLSVVQGVGSVPEQARFEASEEKAKKISAAIRAEVRTMAGAKTAREVARCDYETVIGYVQAWEDYETIQRIRRG